MTRHLDWPDCYNARDLGGLRTADGGSTRWRAVVRSDILARLTDAGRRALYCAYLLDLSPFEVFPVKPDSGPEGTVHLFE